ncbi:MAG: aspA [Actinotalea sp.]|nr:aspA [Actinotalea sp.]
MRTRTEHDLLGVREIPAQAYYGIHTARAVENFPITGVTVGSYPVLVRALAMVKEAAAAANLAAGELEPAIAGAIRSACREIRDGALHDQFVVDVVQGGAGTSTNMNANEVIANLALELLGEGRGSYGIIHPIEHVNRSQSTNDTYPTAIKVALYESVEELLGAMARLRAALMLKSGEFAEVLKIGRTQLQEAVPMTLGQEFGSFAAMVAQDERLLRTTADLLLEVNLGGTAIGTGLTAPALYVDRVVEELAAVTGVPFVAATDRIESTQGTGAFVALSGVLKGMALKLSKICNDLRLLSSGPRAGFVEIYLPAVQAGSSIMPGKVNPVIPEVVNQIAFAVVGRDVTVSMAAEAGQLQLNAFEPLMAVSLLDSLSQLRAGCDVLAERCIAGVTANTAGLRTAVEQSLGLVTALLPVIGYERATMIAALARQPGSSVLALLHAEGIEPADLERMLLGPVATPAGSTAPGSRAVPGDVRRPVTSAAVGTHVDG